MLNNISSLRDYRCALSLVSINILSLTGQNKEKKDEEFTDKYLYNPNIINYPL
jgi:hypothetical protein